MSEKYLNINKVAIAYCRLVWGDRNMRYWQIIKQKREPDPVKLDVDDQQIRANKGRPWILNNKDPDGVSLFKRNANLQLLNGFLILKVLFDHKV